ncbi:MAG: hypothetical protein HZC36_00030 [Armatimonadetes bacterium]|nr:hypothetical protein [Armatimonadota bacterium]
MKCNVARSAWVSLSLLALGTSSASGQNWQDQGSIKSREYKNEIRNGNVIEATEFFSLEYQVSTWVEEDEPSVAKVLSCDNVCNGKVHKEHSKCDFSCDDRCQTPHKATIKGYYEPYQDAMRAATAAANALAIKGGGSVSPNDWSQRVSQALAAFRKEAKKQKKWEFQHTGPCSMETWIPGFIGKRFHVRGTMTKVGFSMSRGVRTPINEVVGTHEQIVAYSEVPADELVEHTNSTYCFCYGEPEEDKIGDMIKKFFEQFNRANDAYENPFKDLQLPDLSDLFGHIRIDDPMGVPIRQDSVTYEVLGDNMNNGQLQVTNKTGMDVVFTMPYGTLFYPDDPGCQIMSSMQHTQLRIPSWSTATLQLSAWGGDLIGVQDKATFRWACTEMAKHEPSLKNKWKVRPGHDIGLKLLGSITNKSRFRGPWDQARVWIYTDKASRTEINKRMVPGIAAGRFVMLLNDVRKFTGVDFAEKGYSDTLEPNLVGEGVCLDESSLKRVVGMIADVKPKDLAQYLNGSAAKVAGLASSDPKDGPNHVAWTASALFRSDDEGVLKAAAKVLLAAGKDSRAAIAKAGGLEGLRSLLASGKADLCSLALDVFEAYGDEDTKQIVMACIEGLKDDKLKARAAKLAGVEFTP